MAIINGDYCFLDLRDIKNNVIETFTEYFGEEYRDTIKNRLDRVIFAPYHSLDYINEYYLEHINRYSSEIYYRTLENLGITESTPELERILKSYGSIRDNALRDVVYYDNSLTGSVNRRINEETLRPVADAFGVNTGSLEGDRKELVRIYKTYLATIREVENENSCDVFYDTQVITYNQIDFARRLLDKAKKLGLPVSDSDRELMSRHDLELCDLLDLDSFGSLFMDSVSYPGSISYFSSARQKELEENPEQKIFIIQHRLQYLYKNGAMPAFFTSEEIQTDDFVYNMDASKTEKLLREYYFQLVSCKDIIPDCKTVDALEAYREELSKSMAHNTRINRQMQSLGVSIGKDAENFFACNRYPEGKEKKQTVTIGMNFDPNYDLISFLEILMHELNHAISFFNHRKIGGDKVIKTRGVSVSRLKVVDGKIMEEVFDHELDNLEEYCNQMQTRELIELYMEKFGIPYMPESDFDIRKKNAKFSSLYEDFGFIAGEFYSMFSPELKKAKVENIPLYYDYSPHTEKKTPGSIVSLVKEKVSRVVSPRNPNNGKIDYAAAMELARIITEYRAFASEHHMRYSIPENCTPQLLKKLPKYQRIKIQEFMDRRDKVMRKLSMDHKLVKKTRSSYEPQVVADVFFDMEADGR